MEGLILLGNIQERHLRPEFKVIVDKEVYDCIKQFASNADMQQIDGWARSFYTLEGLMTSIMQFRKPLITEPTDEIWYKTKQEVAHDIAHAIPRVESLRFEDQLDSVPFESSSAAGYSYHGKKGEGNNFTKAKTIANAAIRSYDEEIYKVGFNEATDYFIQNGTPDVAFTRTQLAKLPSIKVRIVFGEAFHNILIEGLSAAPLLAAFKRSDTFYFTGRDPTKQVPRILHDMGYEPGWFICLDWKSFDASVQLWEIEHAFACLENVLIFKTHLSRRAFDYARESFKKRKLAAPDGTLWMRTGGIPSGSYFTNIIGSIVNYTRIKYLCSRLELDILNCYVQGDDSVIKLPPGPRPDMAHMAMIGEAFGWTLNTTKCTVTQDADTVTFLGRSQMHQLNTRERLKVLRLMCFPEYEVESPDISTARVRAIATDAGFNDPLFNKILRAMKTRYGESETIPPHLRTYVDRFDFQDVNM